MKLGFVSAILPELSFEELIDYAAGQGFSCVEVCCWPGGNNLATTPAIWRRMFAEIPSDFFGLNFDPSHLLWQQMDYIKPLYEFKDKLFHVHLKDARVYREKLDEVGIMATPLDFIHQSCPDLEISTGQDLYRL